jgi:solute carrier family 39 (zinc transporter), member 1/2/3
MSLLLLAETISLTNAVSSWSDVQQKVNAGRGSGSGQGEPQRYARTEGEASCPSSAETISSRQQPVVRRFLSRRTSSTYAKPGYAGTECCPVDCTKCVGKVPRGGHSHAFADSAADLVAAKTPHGIPLHLWKVIFQAILTAINVACWLIPLKSKTISENKLGLSLANAFSGGVFLSLAFGHLIPECVAGFAEKTTSLSRLPAETPYLLVLGGYLLIFFVEKVAFDAHDILHEMEEAGQHQAHNHPTPTPTKAPTKESNGENAKLAAAAPTDSPARSVSSDSSLAASSAVVAPSGRSAVILLGALAVHSVLEMMALGLSNSFGDCALLSLSIALHQPAESIALLVAFLKSGMPHSQIIQYLSIFSCMGPVGVALGMAVNEYAAPIVDSVMLAIVAGTFVYVGATEVIPEEWEDSSHKWVKFAALMSGIVSIVAITQYTMSLH